MSSEAYSVMYKRGSMAQNSIHTSLHNFNIRIKQGLFNYFKRPFCMVNIVQNKMPLCLLLSRITVLLQIGADIYICILLV